jgi:endoglucanase
MITLTMNSIRINQLGFYPDSVKSFVVIKTEKSQFVLLNQRGKRVFTGKLKNRGPWLASGEDVKTGDFSELAEPGLYTVVVDGCEPSFPFVIGDNLYKEAAYDVLKAMTFQRCQHKDTTCPFHPSSGRTKGALNSPGGWYDAGDYGKYVVNGAFSVGLMMALYDILPLSYVKNDKSLLLEEIRFELDWILTMQDEDGGVYHKITGLVHDDFVPPDEAQAERYVIGKSTAASLDFSACLAQASRIWAEQDSEFSQKTLVAAEKAWTWSLENRGEYFTNPEGCNTGEYGDSDLKEEFFWAAAELYAATGKDEYREQIKDDLENVSLPIGENWRQYTANIGYYSLLASEKASPKERKDLLSGLEKTAQELLEKIKNIPYDIPVDDFQWGSNSDILDAAMLLALAHHYLGNQCYLDGTVQTTDYLLGKNALGLSFITGYGIKSPRHPHHRLFVDREFPEPGFVVGGPNGNREDAPDLRKESVYYPTCLPARAYVDAVESYASNEICINWNAPAIFVFSYLEEVFRK